MTLDLAAARSHIATVWERDVLPALQDYIRIPNVSPAFDPEWSTKGHMDRATALFLEWARARPAVGPVS
ncbi:MAG: hypothetical protein N2037_06855, partial [Acidimicrobiales bacterium]|nr:hypothetical protein [Acidimicrobiales bacterium]